MLQRNSVARGLDVGGPTCTCGTTRTARHSSARYRCTGASQRTCIRPGNVRSVSKGCRIRCSKAACSSAAICAVETSCKPSPVYDGLSEGLEAPVQLLYLLTLLGFLVVGAFLVVRQVLVRRELEEAAKVLGERIRTGEASSEDCFELGVILLRKKLYTQATKNLEKARKSWDGEPEELAQVHNALGFAYFSMERYEVASQNYRKAVELQPGYVTAWNNLGDALEKSREYESALKAYEEALSYAPDNKVAQGRADALRTRLRRVRA